MKAPFRSVGALRPGHTWFDLSYDKLIDMDMGEIHIAQCDEVVPGDVWKQKIEAVVRMQPAVAPFLHNVDMCFWTWFVPYRILDENWEEFITGGEDGDSTVMLPRWIPPVGGYAKHTPWDDMGFPTGVRPSEACCPISYPRSARNMIYNEYVRDQNYQDEIELDSDDMLYINWQKDMFTSALPFQQRGTAPAIPLSGTAKVIFNMTGANGVYPESGDDQYYEYGNSTNMPIVRGYPYNKGESTPIYGGEMTIPVDGVRVTDLSYLTPDETNIEYERKGVFNNSDPGTMGPGNMMVFPRMPNPSGSSNELPPLASWEQWLTQYNKVDLAQISGVSSTDIRTMLQVQKWLERNARAGVRYTEFLQSHFGIKPRDDRLQRPEYLGGFKAPLVVSEVVQTSSTDAETPQGNLAGHGLVAARGKLCSYRVVEYGLIMTLCCIRPKSVYTQGIDRQWLRRSRYDFFFPEFVNLSEQGIEAEELYAVDRSDENIEDPDTHEIIGNNNRKIIGFIGKYDEMRSKRSIVCGDMRNTYDYWTLARMWNTQPEINGEFMKCKPSKRVFADQNEQDKSFICHLGNNILCARPMPLVAEPGLADHH